MIIRAATDGDHAALLTIWLRSVRASHLFLSEEEIQELLPIVRDQALPSMELWVLDEESELVGFAGLDGTKLEALFIAPEYFRRGAGRLLVQHARSLKGPLSVDVNEQNPEAVKFYEAMGFHRVGRSDLDGAGRPYPLLHYADVM